MSTIADEKPEDSEIGVRWGGTRGRWDFSIMMAEVFETVPVIELRQGNQLIATYPRYQMLGGGFNLSRGKFLWKGEIAYKKKPPTQSNRWIAYIHP